MSLLDATQRSQTPQGEASDCNVDCNVDYDVIVIGAGIGGLVAATQLVARGARVLVLERYLIPGGSAGGFARSGYQFDVGASMIFGFGQQGTTNLLTRALAAVGQSLETIPDPVQVSYHLPDLDISVPRNYENFLQELDQRFPQEQAGIRRFYGTCWRIFRALNTIDLRSLEEMRYVARSFLQHPQACLRLARYLPVNVGEVARQHIRDPRLLRFIDMECYSWSVMPASHTPMINAGMVFSDRHYGGVNYPKGGVAKIAEALVKGLQQHGGQIHYRARVTEVLTQQGRAVGVRLSDNRAFYARRIISNCTRWQTFGDLLSVLPAQEQRWQQRYRASPSFLSLHLGVQAEVVPAEMTCHHILLEDWTEMERPGGTVFVSIPTQLDPHLAPSGRQIIHAFTPSWISEWQGLAPTAYKRKKFVMARALVQRLERILPGLTPAIEHQEVGTPRTHRRFLGRQDGTYGPIPARQLRGLLGMPFNRTAVPGLYVVGDSTFPGQGLNAVAFSGFACAHRVATDLGLR
ncbi:carotenoid isomerase [Lyngbya confervoides]|uniref:prolycopene isomerase n=1 Tax=Lyngbya confervoides BDU141951 TaxID=1574623 RepID=A0ABD4T6Y4_9CYAN|nr:carotenoid isomerase [Lyngbya confervoides]MCM1984240.1 carotene isomerase [Lyngbya confervoides BDU141951]